MNEYGNYINILKRDLVAASHRLSSENSAPFMRTHRPSIRFAAAGVAAFGLAVVVVIIAVVGLGTETQRAAAEWSRWTPSPTTAADSQVGSAASACLTDAFSLTIAAPPWQVLAADTRGPFTLILLQAQSRNAIATCLADPSGAHITGAGGGYPGGVPPAVPQDKVQLEEFGRNTFPPQQSGEVAHTYSVVSGQVGAGVSTITLLLSNGERVTPTIGHGWFLAWWPTWVPAVQAEVTSPQGTVDEPIHAASAHA